MAHRHNVAMADKKMRFAEGDASRHDLRGARDDEQSVAVLLYLGMLMRLTGILDRQVMKPELGLERDSSSSLGSNSPIQTT